MAAPISGVHKRLKSSETPWREKLKLGRTAWKSRRVVLPRREQVLLDWATGTLIQHCVKKAVLEEQILREMWLFLEDILKSTRLKSLARSGAIFLNSSFHQVITATLSNACQEEAAHMNFIPSVLDCMEVILAQPSLSAVLLSRYDICVELVRSMLCLTVRLCVADIQESVPSLLSLLVTVLDKCTTLQRQQHKQTKVFQSVCEELLSPAVCCCWVLNNHSNLPSSTTSHVVIKIQEHLHQGLFVRENAAAFEKHLCDTTDKHLCDTTGSPSVGSKGVELYFQQLDRLLKNTPGPSMLKICAFPAGDIEDAVLLYLPVAYSSFLTSPACTDVTGTGFAMLQALCGFTLPLSTAENDLEAGNVQEEDCMDVDADADRGDVGVKTQERRLVAVRDLLQTALDLNIYRALDDTTSGGKQLAWLRQVLQTLLQIPAAPTAAGLDSVRLLLEMNHQVVAPRLADIWTCSWLLLDKDVAPAVQASQDKLLCRLFETYAKLRQVDTLLAAVLDAVHRNQDQLSYSKTFPPSTLQRWSELVQGLPLGLAMEIWQRMLNKLQEQFQLETPQLECTSACVEQMTTLLSLFLLHLRLWDVNIPSPTATRVDQLMASTCSAVITPLLTLCLRTEQVDEHLCFSALHLCHTWCQLNMLSTHMKGSKYSGESLPSLGVTEEWDFSLQYPHLSPGDWATLCQKLLKAGSKRIRYVLEMLSLQRVKMLRMLPNTSEQDTVKRRIQNAISFAINICTTDEDKESGWDGQVTSVTRDNYPTAHWYLVCSHVGLIAPLCTRQKLVLLSQYILQTVVSESCPKTSAGLLTRAMISADLLNSASYLELLAMQEAMITAIISGLADTVKCSRNTAAVRQCVKVLQKLGEDTHPESAITGPEEDTPQLSESITSAAAALQSLQEDVQKKCPVELSEKQLQKILCYFKVLKQLPLQCLSDVSSLRCVLASLAVNCFLGASDSASAPAVLKTNLEVLRDVMTGQKKTSLWETLDAAVTMKGLLLTCQQTRLQDVSLSPALEATYQDLLYHLLWSVVRSAEGTSSLTSYTKYLCQALQGLVQSPSPRDGHKLDWLFISAGCTLSAGLMVMQNKVKVPAAQSDTVASCTRKLAACVSAALPRTDRPAVTTAMAAALRVQMADSQVGENWTPVIQHQVCRLQSLLTDIQDKVQSLRACLAFLKTVAGGGQKCGAVLPEQFGPTVYNLAVQLVLKIHSTSRKEPSESAPSSDLADAVAEAEALLLIVCRCSQPEEFSTYIHGLQKHLDTSVCAALQLWQLMLKEEWKDEKRDALDKILPQLVLQLQAVLQKSSSKVTEDVVLQQAVVPGLLTTAAILQFGQGTLPDHVAGAALHGCLSVQHQNQPGRTFAATFHAACRVLTSLLQHHTKVARSAVPSLMACCRTLLVALVHEGRQDQEASRAGDSADVVLCAGDFERLMAAMVQKVDLTRTAAFLVAEYVSQLQHGTLHPEVKKSLVPSVYLLLDVCGMHGSKLLAAALDPGLREIYKALHTDYNRYHKYRGKV